MSNDNWIQHNQAKDICEECGETLEVTESPSPVMKIPFTKLEIWRWGKTTYCLSCINEQDRREFDQIYEAGMQHGYEAVFRDANN